MDERPFALLGLLSQPRIVKYVDEDEEIFTNSVEEEPGDKKQLNVE